MSLRQLEKALRLVDRAVAEAGSLQLADVCHGLELLARDRAGPDWEAWLAMRGIATVGDVRRLLQLRRLLAEWQRARGWAA